MWGERIEWVGIAKGAGQETKWTDWTKQLTETLWVTDWNEESDFAKSVILRLIQTGTIITAKEKAEKTRDFFAQELENNPGNNRLTDLLRQWTQITYFLEVLDLLKTGTIGDVKDKVSLIVYWDKQNTEIEFWQNEMETLESDNRSGTIRDILSMNIMTRLSRYLVN